MTKSVAAQLPATDGRCGIYVLSFADGEFYVGQAVDVVSRFGTHRKTYDDIIDLHFWRFPRTELDSAEQAAIRALQEDDLQLRNVTYAAGRLGASALDAFVTPGEQQQWLDTAPTGSAGDDERPDRRQQRVSGRVKFNRLAADPRFEALLPVVRRYVVQTIPFPRRTEFSHWSVSASPDTNKNTFPRMFTVTVHALETLFAFAPVGEPHRTIIALNVDLATLQQRWRGRLDDLVDRFGAAYVVQMRYRVRPGVLRLEVEGARNLMRLLDIDGVIDAARRLNLDLMRKGPAMQWRSHSFGLADRLFDEVAEPSGEPLDVGLTYDALGDIPRAEEFYRRAASAGEPEAAFRLGELWTERGKPREADRWYRQAGRAGYAGVRRPEGFGNTYALVEHGRRHHRQGDLEEAADYFYRAVEAGDLNAYLELGDVLHEQDDPDLAMGAYLIAAACGQAAGWFGVGLIHHQDGDLDVAESYYQRAADGGDVPSLVEIGFLQESRGDLEQAQASYRLAISAGDVDALVHLGDLLLLELSDTVTAETYYRRAIKRGSATGMIGLGILHEQNGDVTQAESSYRRAIDMGRTRGLINLGSLLAHKNNDKAAEEAYRDAIDAGHTDAHLLLGDLLYVRGDHEGAGRHYRRAAAADHAEAVTRLGGLFLDLGDLDAAEPLLRVAAEKDPAAMHCLSLLLDQRGHAAQADQWRRRAADAGYLDDAEQIDLSGSQMIESLLPAM